MMLLTETRERFLLAIAAQIPVERIAEIHFFQPIKLGRERRRGCGGVAGDYG